MTVNRTTLLDLPLPVSGTESGTWGDTTNNGLTQYLDIAIAGMSNLTSANFTAGALTIETTEGNSSATNISATSAQYAGFRVTSLAVNSTITVGNTGTTLGRSYRLINADSTYTLTFKATGQTGVTLQPGQSAVVAFNGTDYVFVGSVGPGSSLNTPLAVIGNATAGAEIRLPEDTDNGSNYVAIKAPDNIASNATLTAPAVTDTLATIGTPQTFTAAQTFRAANAIRSEAASTQDAVVIAGRAGGTSSYAATITPTTLSASRTITLPNADINFTTGLGVANGGTGTTTLTANNVILGNGTSAVQFVAPGTNGNVLTSNGTTWTSAAGPTSLTGVTDGSSTFNTNLGVGTVNNPGAINNTAVGYQALRQNNLADGNCAFGYQALQALVNAGGNTNHVAIGNRALYSLVSNGNNVAVGDDALFSLQNGSWNTAVGSVALQAATSGYSNVGVGRDAGGAITTGFNNTCLGVWAGKSGTNNLTTGSNNIVIGYSAEASSASVSNEVTIGNTSITSTRLRGMVQLNAAMLEQATVSATAATGTINFDARTQSVLYYTGNASANWTLNVRGASGVSLDSVMSTGQSLTIAFLVTNGATAYYQSGFQVDSVSVTPKWQGGTAPTAGNASSIDAYVITIIKTGSATFTALASQTKFA